MEREPGGLDEEQILEALVISECFVRDLSPNTYLHKFHKSRIKILMEKLYQIDSERARQEKLDEENL